MFLFFLLFRLLHLHSSEWGVSVCGVFVDDSANGGWFLLRFDATLEAGCGF